jgi:hypothetical protein
MGTESELNDPWCMWYTPNITGDLSSKYGSWENANAKLTQNLHDVTTVEDFWVCYKALPPATKLPKDENVLFFRKGIEPKWEDPAFKAKPGGRFVCQLDPVSSADKFIERLLAVTLGEQISVDTNTSGLVGGVRFVKKDNKRDIFVRVEVWITDKDKMQAVKDMLFKTASDCGINNLNTAQNCQFKAF